MQEDNKILDLEDRGSCLLDSLMISINARLKDHFEVRDDGKIINDNFLETIYCNESITPVLFHELAHYYTMTTTLTGIQLNGILEGINRIKLIIYSILKKENNELKRPIGEYIKKNKKVFKNEIFKRLYEELKLLENALLFSSGDSTNIFNNININDLDITFYHPHVIKNGIYSFELPYPVPVIYSKKGSNQSPCLFGAIHLLEGISKTIENFMYDMMLGRDKAWNIFDREINIPMLYDYYIAYFYFINNVKNKVFLTSGLPFVIISELALMYGFMPDIEEDQEYNFNHLCNFEFNSGTIFNQIIDIMNESNRLARIDKLDKYEDFEYFRSLLIEELKFPSLKLLYPTMITLIKKYTYSGLHERYIDCINYRVKNEEKTLLLDMIFKPDKEILCKYTPSVLFNDCVIQMDKNYEYPMHLILQRYKIINDIFSNNKVKCYIKKVYPITCDWSDHCSGEINKELENKKDCSFTQEYKKIESDVDNLEF